eukprot:gene20358-biopygen23558
MWCLGQAVRSLRLARTMLAFGFCKMLAKQSRSGHAVECTTPSSGTPSWEVQRVTCPLPYILPSRCTFSSSFSSSLSCDPTAKARPRTQNSLAAAASVPVLRRARAKRTAQLALRMPKEKHRRLGQSYSFCDISQCAPRGAGTLVSPCIAHNRMTTPAPNGPIPPKRILLERQWMCWLEAEQRAALSSPAPGSLLMSGRRSRTSQNRHRHRRRQRRRHRRCHRRCHQHAHHDRQHDRRHRHHPSSSYYHDDYDYDDDDDDDDDDDGDDDDDDDDCDDDDDDDDEYDDDDGDDDDSDDVCDDDDDDE